MNRTAQSLHPQFPLRGFRHPLQIVHREHADLLRLHRLYPETILLHQISIPGNFAADPWTASVGAAGWLGTNPQRQAVPYPSQTYYVDMRGRVFCQTARVDDAGNVTARQRYHACLPR